MADELRCIHAFGQRRGLRDTASRRFRHQVGFGAEVLVEAAVGEARCGHQISNADPIEAALAKQPGGCLDDVSSIGLRLCLGDFSSLSEVGLLASEIPTEGY